MLPCFGCAIDQSARSGYSIKTTAVLGPVFDGELNTDSSMRRRRSLDLTSLLKKSVLALGIVLAAISVPVLQAESLHEQIWRAAELNDKGDFRETISLLGSLLQSEAQSDEPVLGVAWNLYGVALESTGDEEGARRSYERSIGILGNAPAAKQNLAAALDNLGSLKAEMGQLAESQSLLTRARALYGSIGDQAGIGRTSIHLALIALGQGKRKQAHKFVADAFSSLAEVRIQNTGDLAALYHAQALERSAFGDPQGALISVDNAIESWAVHYGPRYYLLASGYCLRGQLEAELNDREQAVKDFKLSLEILRLHNDLATRSYFVVEAAFAKALRRFGMREDAEQMEQSAQSGLALLRNPCPGCTFSANSIR